MGKRYNLLEKQKELEMGIKVEREHSGTIQKIKDGLGSNNPLSDEDIFKLIAEDHLRELPDYYTRLKEMEKE